MFAVVQTGGRQFQVSPSDIIRIDHIDAAPGTKVSLGKVLLLRAAEQTHVGAPEVEGAEVTAEVLGQNRDKKIRVFFYRRRKNSKKTKGHRQQYTAVKIHSIAWNGQIWEAPAPKQAAPAVENASSQEAPAASETSQEAPAASEG